MGFLSKTFGKKEDKACCNVKIQEVGKVEIVTKDVSASLGKQTNESNAK